MSSDPFYLAIIPARGGSKEIPRKNVRPLGGKPLIVHSIELALNSPSISFCMVSTDDQEIAEVSRSHGAEVPFMRPPELAEDSSAMEPVLQHAVMEVEGLIDRPVTHVVLLLPTVPLRPAGCVEEAIALQKETQADSVVSVSRHDYPVSWLLKIEAGILKPLRDDFGSVTQRQVAPEAYRKNDAVFVIKRDLLIDRGTLFGDHTVPLIIDADPLIDINSEWEFDWAEWQYERGENG